MSCIFRPSGERRTLMGLNASGELIHIDDAPRGRAGLVCPDCGVDLVAHKGPVRVAHFVHWEREACITAGETALHRVAKELLMERPEFLLPKFVVLGETCRSAVEVRLDHIEIETWEGGFRPDLRAEMTAGSGEAAVTRILYIEIRVTHAVDEAKIEKVRLAGHSMIEIDLSAVKRDLTRSELSRLLRRTAPRTWVHHRQEDEFRARIEEKIAEERRIGEEARARAKREAADLANAMSRARSRPPAFFSPTILSEAARRELGWAAIGHKGFYEIEADDEVFDVPPIVWRSEVLEFLAPWTDPDEGPDLIEAREVRPAAEARNDDARRKALDVRAGQLTITILRHLLQRRWIKREFRIKGDRNSPDTMAIYNFLDQVIGKQGPSEAFARHHRTPLGAYLRFCEEHAENRKQLRSLEAIERILQLNHRILLRSPGSEEAPSRMGDRWLAGLWSVGGPPAVDWALRSLREELKDDRMDTVPAMDAERLTRLGLELHDQDGPATAAFLNARYQLRADRVQGEIDRRVDAETDRIHDMVAGPMGTMAALGPWPADIGIEALPDRDRIRLVVLGEPEASLSYFDADYMRRRTWQIEAICSLVRAVWGVIDGLGLPQLEISLRNIILRRLIRDGCFEDSKEDRIHDQFDRMKTLKAIVSGLAAIEKKGPYGMEGATPEDFAMRALISRPDQIKPSILGAVFSGNLVEARRLSNLISTPRSKPGWIIKELPAQLRRQ